jgi:CP family cyanate transporter-like MFS transporter
VKDAGIKDRAVLSTILLTTMGVATFTALSLGLLAPVFIEDLGITRSDVGIAFSVNAIGAAILSPIIGPYVDRIGGRTALVSIVGASAVSFVIYGIAWSFGVMLVASLFGAVAQAGANPSTNKLIADEVPSGSQGVVVGIKQSGVQLFIFLGGIVVPSAAIWWGRSAAYLILAGVAVLTAVAALALVAARDVPSHRPQVTSVSRVPPDIWWISAYGFLLGFAGSSTVLFALFIVEQLDKSLVVAGYVIAVGGFLAIPGRIAWARHAERTGEFRTPLLTIALISVGASASLMVANSGPWWFVVVAAVLTAVGSSSWNSVGMLGLIVIAGPAAAGRASGIVLFGFLLGLGAGPPLFGWMVDTSGNYMGVWWLAMGASTLGAIVMLVWRPTHRADAR